MVSIAETTYHMLSRHMSNDNEELDFPLYPDPNMFSHSFPFPTGQSFNMEATYAYPRAQDGYPASTGLNSSTMFAEAPQYPLESPELRAAPSNYSTASAPSATSSAMGSPHSIHGHVVPVPEWAPHGLGLNPSIVGFDNYGQGNEYTFQPTGMDDFALEFNAAKPNGFVGECENVSRSASRQHGSISSNCESLSSLSTFVISPKAMDAPTDQMRTGPASMSMASPISPVSTVGTDFRDDVFKSPVSAFSKSPSDSRRPSRAFNAPLYASASTIPRTQDMRSSISSISQICASETSPSYATYHQSPFFSQSSGNFVAPLESSCRFPLSFQHRFSSIDSELSANRLFFRPINSSSPIHHSPNLCDTIKRKFRLSSTNIPWIAIFVAHVEKPKACEARESIPLLIWFLVPLSTTSPTIHPIIQQSRWQLQQRGVARERAMHISRVRKSV